MSFLSLLLVQVQLNLKTKLVCSFLHAFFCITLLKYVTLFQSKVEHLEQELKSMNSVKVCSF